MLKIISLHKVGSSIQLPTMDAFYHAFRNDPLTVYQDLVTSYKACGNNFSFYPYRSTVLFLKNKFLELKDTATNAQKDLLLSQIDKLNACEFKHFPFNETSQVLLDSLYTSDHILFFSSLRLNLGSYRNDFVINMKLKDDFLCPFFLFVCEKNLSIRDLHFFPLVYPVGLSLTAMDYDSNLKQYFTSSEFAQHDRNHVAVICLESQKPYFIERGINNMGMLMDNLHSQWAFYNALDTSLSRRSSPAKILAKDILMFMLGHEDGPQNPRIWDAEHVHNALTSYSSSFELTPYASEAEARGIPISDVSEKMHKAVYRLKQSTHNQLHQPDNQCLFLLGTLL